VTRQCFGAEDNDAGLYVFDGQPKTVEEAVDRKEYFQHTRQNCPLKSIACPVEMQSLESSPNWNSREDLVELLEMMHHMVADLRDIKQSRVPSLAPKPRDITTERTP
jgi:hypothetical protein